MRRGDLRILLLVAGIVALLTWLLLRRWNREGFQVAAAVTPTTAAATVSDTNDAATTATGFWKLVSELNSSDQATVLRAQAQVSTVQNPSETETLQVIFPKYVSLYALVKYKNNPSKARDALFSNYNQLMADMSATVYDPAKVSAFTADPKVQTCTALGSLKDSFKMKLSNLKRSIVDVSGTAFTAGGMRDENMKFQNQFLDICSKEPTSPACIDLASKEPILFPLLATYDAVNSSLYEKEIDIQESLLTVEDTFKLLNCSNPTPLTYNVDQDPGTIDTETLRDKLQTLSPYYLSPATLQYITDFLIKPEEVDSALNTTADLYAHIAKTTITIKTISGVGM